MNKRYVIDMRGVRGWRGPMDIPVAKGRFNFLFDVLENEMDSEWVEQRHAYGAVMRIRRGFSAGNSNMPLGFDAIPPGALIREATK